MTPLQFGPVLVQRQADPVLHATPIILLTSLQDLGLDAKGLQAGADRVLRKQFSSLDVVTVIEELLAKKSGEPQ